MRSRALASLVAAVAVAGGCGGGAAAPSSTVDSATVDSATVDSATNDTAPSTPATTDQASPTPTESAPSTDVGTNDIEVPGTTAPVVDEWEQSTAELVTAGIPTKSNIPADTSDVQAIGSTTAGYLVAGSVNGGFVVWRSVDLASFEPVYSEVCCERYLRASSIHEFAGSLLIGGTGEFGPNRTDRAFLLRSEDGGASWMSVDDSLFTSDANRVDRIVVTDGTVIVETVDDRVSGAQPQSVAAWSDDLETWHPVELPGRRPDDWPSFVHDSGAVYAFSPRNDGPDGGFGGWVIWRSDDGGRQFVESPPLSEPEIGGFLAVRGALVAVPSVYQAEYLHADAQGLALLDADGAWRDLEADTGTWGDGWVTAYPTATSTGRTYTLVSRTVRASIHYCYDDVETCQQPETALLATEDGTTWADVAGFPNALRMTGGPNSLSVDPEGSIVMLAANHQDPAVRVIRWTRDSAPPEVERPDYPAPDIPVPLYDHEQPLEIGDERRYPLGLGGCWGMYLDDQSWEPESPLPDPPPAEWPYRSVEWADGPSGFVYGRIHRLAADTVEFSIEGVGPVATFHPAPPTDDVCF